MPDNPTFVVVSNNPAQLPVFWLLQTGKSHIEKSARNLSKRFGSLLLIYVQAEPFLFLIESYTEEAIYGIAAWQ